MLLQVHRNGDIGSPRVIGSIRITNEEPIRVARDGDREENLREAAQRVADALEMRVRARPELWYQFYDYWKEQE